MSTLRERIEAQLRQRIEAAEAQSAKPAKLDLGPLFKRLDEIIQVVESMHNFSVEPYREKVREIVCATCRQNGEGNCATREQELCGLDKHFQLIVAVVEQELNRRP